MIKNYKHLISRILLNFSLVLLIQFTLEASLIEIEDTEITLNFVNNKTGKIYKKYRQDFIAKTGVHKKIQHWDTFKEALDTNKKRGIAGEVAAKFYFESKGYKILEEHYQERLKDLRAAASNDNGMYTKQNCTTKKGPDNGIDGIFIPKNDNFNNPSKIIINEAKFRKKKTLSINDFGFVAGGIQQSHSQWNSDRFSDVDCLAHLNYGNQNIFRSATLLNRKGILKVYRVKDQ